MKQLTLTAITSAHDYDIGLINDVASSGTAIAQSGANIACGRSSVPA